MFYLNSTKSVLSSRRLLSCLIWLIISFSCLTQSLSATNQSLEQQTHEPTFELAKTPAFQDYVHTLVHQYHFDAQALRRLYQRVVFRPSLIEAINHPHESQPWDQYRQIFITKKRIQSGVDFWHLHRKTLTRASQQFGVPAKIIVAILGIESNYGKVTPSYRAIDALSTLAFAYKKRAKYFKAELTDLLLFARAQHLSPLYFKSSYAGAMGFPQFMPSSYRQYGVDFSHTGTVDLIGDMQDSIGSVANYLKKKGWRTKQPILHSVCLNSKHCEMNDSSGSLITLEQDDQKRYWVKHPNFDVILSYNNSLLYGMAVYHLSDAIEKQYRACYGKHHGSKTAP